MQMSASCTIGHKQRVNHIFDRKDLKHRRACKEKPAAEVRMDRYPGVHSLTWPHPEQQHRQCFTLLMDCVYWRGEDFKRIIGVVVRSSKMSDRSELAT